MKEYNSMVFDQNERESLSKFINLLLDFNIQSEDMYNDIHVRQEDNFVVLEWLQVPYNGSWGGNFQFVDSDETVAKEIIFPDNSTAIVPKDYVEEAWAQWREENPESSDDDEGSIGEVYND